MKYSTKYNLPDNFVPEHIPYTKFYLALEENTTPDPVDETTLETTDNKNIHTNRNFIKSRFTVVS
jgi:hypothetical protein